MRKKISKKTAPVLPILVAAAMLDDQFSEGVAFILDISSRKQAEAERETFAQQRELALRAANLGWWHYDPVTRISTYDKRYTEIFGITGELESQRGAAYPPAPGRSAPDPCGRGSRPKSPPIHNSTRSSTG